MRLCFCQTFFKMSLNFIFFKMSLTQKKQSLIIVYYSFQFSGVGCSKNVNHCGWTIFFLVNGFSGWRGLLIFLNMNSFLSCSFGIGCFFQRL